MKTGLVLMPFTEEHMPRFEFIRHCGEGLGIDVRRVDTYAYSGNILTAIARAISQSDLVIADLTAANANVTYELAIAQCMGQKIVLMTNDRNTVPFDLLAYRTELISRHSPEEAASLVKAMKQALAATYVTGPLGGNVVFGQRVFMRRLAAFLLDCVGLLAVFLVLGLALKAIGRLPEYGTDAGYLLMLAYAELAPLAYFTVLTWRFEGSVGQRLLDLKVVTYDGDRPTFFRSLGRTVSCMLSILTYGIGFLWCLRGPGYRTFHDIASGTMIVRRSGKPSRAPI